MSKIETNKAVVTVDTTKSNLPAGWEDMANDAGAGLGNTTSADYAIPFVSILQALSPQLNKQDGAYIKGAESGQVFNSVTKATVEGEVGIRVVPVAYVFKNVEWKPREQGGGFVAAYTREESPRDVTRDDRGRDILSNGNLLTATAYYYCLLLHDDGSFEQAVISMSSTQLKKSRTWNSMMSQIKLRGPKGLFTPPTYSHIYRLKTVPESNNNGNWYGWAISNEGMLDDRDIYVAAKEFSASVLSGAVEAKHTTVDAAPAEDVPF